MLTNKGIFLKHRSDNTFLPRSLCGLPALEHEIQIISMGFWIHSWSISSQASCVLIPLMLSFPLINQAASWDVVVFLKTCQESTLLLVKDSGCFSRQILCVYFLSLSRDVKGRLCSCHPTLDLSYAIPSQLALGLELRSWTQCCVGGSE